MTRYLTTAEVGEYFRTSPDTVRYWRQVRRGPRFVKVGRRVLYRVEDVEAFEAQLGAEGGAA